MSDSFFNFMQKTPCAFSDLPLPAQKALIWRATENGGELCDGIDANIGHTSIIRLM